MAVRSDLPRRTGGRTEQSNIDRAGAAGYGTPSRVSVPLNLEAVNNPAVLAALVQTMFESLVNQLNAIFREKLDKIDDRGRMLSDTYTDKDGRPVRLHKAEDDVDIEVADVFDTANNDLDDVPDGTTHARVLATEISSGQVARVRDTTNSRNIDGGDLIDTANDDADDLAESDTRKWAGTTGADFVIGTSDLDDVDDGSVHARVLAAELSSGQVARVRDTVGARDVAGSAIFDKVADDLDDVLDGSTYLKLAGVDGSNQATGSSFADDVVSGSTLTSAVITEYIAAGVGPGSQGGWDAV